MVSCPVGGRESGLLVSGSVMTLQQHSMLSCLYVLISSLATRLTANVQPSMFVFPSIYRHGKGDARIWGYCIACVQLLHYFRQ